MCLVSRYEPSFTGIYGEICFVVVWPHLCSQAPFGMHGMIIGLFWFLFNVFCSIGLHIILYVPISSSSVLSCTSWHTIIFGFVGLVGLVVYVLTARWYVKRIRDTDLDLRNEIEQRWEQRLIREDSYNNNNQTDYDTFIISSVENQYNTCKRFCALLLLSPHLLATEK